MPEYLKGPPRLPGEDSSAVRATVSQILEAVQADGIDAVRRYSRKLDGWDPPTFRVDRETIDQAVDAAAFMTGTTLVVDGGRLAG